MILRSLSIVIGTLLFSGATWAQAPSPAQMGLVVATPNVVQVLDSSKNWAAIGTVDPTTHLFSPAGLPPLVNSFNTRTGAITLSSSDVTTALGFAPAPLASPTFTGVPAAPTASPGTATTQLATTQFVGSAITAGAYVLPTASTTVKGGVKVDGTTITATGAGVISGTPAGITANSTATSGFSNGGFPNSGSLLMSDGSKVQASDIYPTFGGNVWVFDSKTYSADGSAQLNFIQGGGTTAYLSTNYGWNTNGTYGGYGFATAYTMPYISLVALYPNGMALRGVADKTIATAFRVYNTYTDASNGEWGGFDWLTTPNVLTIGTNANGTGSKRVINIVGGNNGSGPGSLDYSLSNGGVWSLFAANGAGGLVPGHSGGAEYLGTNNFAWGTIHSVSYFAGPAGSQVAGVSCAAGTVSLATLVVTNGIITHC